MAAPFQPTATDTIKELEVARLHALKDRTHYGVLIPSLLPIFSPAANLELRRWGSDFLAESFSNPGVDAELKETLSLQILKPLKDHLEAPAEDAAVIRNVIQIATCIYPIVFKYM